MQHTDFNNTYKFPTNADGSKVSNPIKKNGLIAKINALNGKNITKTSTSYTEKPSQAVNYPEFIKLLNEIMSKNNNIHETHPDGSIVNSPITGIPPAFYGCFH